MNDTQDMIEVPALVLRRLLYTATELNRVNGQLQNILNQGGQPFKGELQLTIDAEAAIAVAQEWIV